METITVMGVINATSNKQGGKFESQNPQKSVYINVDKENADKLKAFGLTEYTPTEVNAETGEVGLPYFQVKMSKEVSIYNGSELLEKISGMAVEDSVNYSSNGKVVGLAIMKGENMNNKFARLYAIDNPNGFFTENVNQSPFA